MNSSYLIKRLAVLLLAIQATSAWAQTPNCGSEVVLNDGVLEVAATGDDDTDNIQCAFDEATRLGIPVIKLGREEYAVTQIIVTDFEGTFEGSGAPNTTLVLFDDGIDCAAQIALGEVPAGLKFIRGNVKVARITIGAANPCLNDDNPLFFVLHFTGQAAGASCDNDTGFSFVDRTEIIGLGGNPNIWGIGVLAEGQAFSACNDTLLGTAKFNRGLVAGFNTGITLSLRGSGQVDINFSVFDANFRHVYAENANQLMTVQASDFFSDSMLEANHTSVEIFGFEGTPSENRAVIFRNRFDLNQASDDFTVAGVGVFKDAPVNLSLVISDNRLEMDGPEGVGMFIQDVDGANISANRFSGFPNTAIYLNGGGSGTTITGNNFSSNLPGFTDIFLDEDTSGAIVALNTLPFIQDLGTGNTVLGSPLAINSTEKSFTVNPDKQSKDLTARHEAAFKRVSRALVRAGADASSVRAAPKNAEPLRQVSGALSR